MTVINYYFNHDHPLRPFTGSDYANKDSFSPVNALRTEPGTQPGFWPCEQDGKWVIIPDHRGTKVYDTATAQESEIKELGELPDGVTTIAPDVEFPKWNGKKWVTDKKAKKENDIAAAEAQKQFLIAEVHAETQMLQTKLSLKRIKPAELELLNAWLDYLDLLEAVDTSTVPDIDWPQKPQ
ncbi:tail fiber assembly protein [Morganella morganii]|uniref:tail fiber assembly protein n=1 Tax=Morganella morganii TaxID=582 RepID=UPI00091CB15C|nr:tail fiber assembly protein [Morganella morganii]SHM01729.1 virus tail fibre assembly protein, lambda gpK [Morganella morganii]